MITRNNFIWKELTKVQALAIFATNTIEVFKLLDEGEALIEDIEDILTASDNNLQLAIEVGEIVSRGTKADDYKHIVAWGSMLGSHEYYVRNEQRKAFQLNLPIDTCYINDDDKAITFRDIRAKTTKDRIRGLVESYSNNN